MKTGYTWKKKLLSNLTLLYQDGNQVGHFTDHGFRRTTIGELKGRKCTFITHGFFKQETRILNEDQSAVIGTIKHGAWNNSADITYEGKRFSFKNKNFWYSKWNLSDGKDTNIEYHGSQFGGNFESSTVDPCLMLAGLQISNFNQGAFVAGFMALFIIIIAGN
jgi:hypothetical protein